MRKNRRSRLMVDNFQGKLLRRFVAYWFIYQFTTWNFLFFWQLIVEGKGNPAEQHLRFFGSHYPMLIVFVLLVPFFIWDARKFSHRVAGPICRLRQTILASTAGKPIRLVELRDGDHLTEVADELNALMLVLEERGAVTIDRSGSLPRVGKTVPPANPDDDFNDDRQESPLTSHTV